MTAPRRTRGTADDLDEREVDLGRWRRALVTLWWIPIAGLVLGAILGVLFSFRGGTVYKATALISLGQPTSPGGALVNGFGTNPRAVSQIVSSAAGQAQAANRADMRPGALRGHVSVGAGRDGDRRRRDAVDAADLAHGHRHEAVEHDSRGECARGHRRREDDRRLRRRQDPHLPRDAEERQLAARLDQPPACGADRGDEGGEEPEPARPARDRQPGGQRRGTARQPDRAAGDAAAAARVRDAGREREDHRAGPFR